MKLNSPLHICGPQADPCDTSNLDLIARAIVEERDIASFPGSSFSGTDILDCAFARDERCELSPGLVRA